MTNFLKTNQRSIWLLVALLTLQVLLFGEALTQPTERLSIIPAAELLEQPKRYPESLCTVEQHISHDIPVKLSTNFLLFQTSSLVTFNRLIHTRLGVAVKRVLGYDFPIFLSQKIIPQSSKKEDSAFLFHS